MVRILIKGGVWKNTEDEILKAAVMKYGKNDWARVASLLNRKSAKQCKARWHEWLDPSIKKTEWHKDEEEKLLHLAKLMPNQWRTIAPIVGRTAAQCMEHYEYLLDQAQEEIGESADDPRRLRPGEIDPAPETKPARPDPIDMDEDEKEMLSEAKARLANTKGKKAKRKLRERTMQETRRLAMLQKRRELKAAGIESKLGGVSNKRKFINYATEIPFQKVPPAGFFDVSEENQEGKKMKLDPKAQGLELAKMEGRHEKEEEERARQKDARAMKKLFKENAPQAIAKIAAENDPVSLRRRVPLSLPSPQVSDVELEDIVKLGQQQQQQQQDGTLLLMPPPSGAPSGGSSSQRSQALVADYAQQSGLGSAGMMGVGAPQRTPMQEDIVMQEAKNLRMLRDAATPLFAVAQQDGLVGEAEAEGVEGPGGADAPQLFAGTGYGGIEPRKATLATPSTFNNLVKGTPSGASVMATPSGAVSVAQSTASGTTFTSQASVLRDPFGLNARAAGAGVATGPGSSGDYDNYSVADSSMAGGASVRSDKLRAKLLQDQLSGRLRSLPEPEYSYGVELPAGAEDVDDEENEGEVMVAVDGNARRVEDATEARARQVARQRALHAQEMARRSTALQRDLPRPQCPSASELQHHHHPQQQQRRGNSSGSSGSSTILALGDEGASAAAVEAVHTEMCRLLEHDTQKYPMAVTGTKGTKLSLPQRQAVANARDAPEVVLEALSDDYLSQARALVQQEAATTSSTEFLAGFDACWEATHKDLMFLPDAASAAGGHYGVPRNEVEERAALRIEFAALRAKFEKEAKRAGKLESRLQVTTAGYLKRGAALQEAMLESFDTCARTRIEAGCFATLLAHESRAMQTRLQRLRQEAETAEAEENAAQVQYAELAAFAAEVL